MKDLVEKAVHIMLTAHKNQVRKTDGSPYVVHPGMVAFKLKVFGFRDEVIAAGLIHDVLEDTNFPEKKLTKELGKEVLEITKAVTEDKNLDWEERKEKYIQTVAQGSEEVKAVSIADKIHNLESILITHKKMGPKIWTKFNRDKRKKMWFENEMLKMFKASWSHPLIDQYEKLLRQVEKLD